MFEARRISDRRRLVSLLKYMNTQSCRVQMMRSYFGEPEGAKCGLCDSCAGLDSEVFDPGSADERHGLHAATDFHARPRRRRRGRGGAYDMPGVPMAPSVPAAPLPPPAPVFETAIPTDLLPPLAAYEIPPADESETTFDLGLWAGAFEAAVPLAGEAVVEFEDGWLTPAATDGDGAGASVEAALEATTNEAAPSEAALGEAAPSEAALGEAAPGTPPAESSDDPAVRWAAVRDANIRPYVDWRPVGPIALPVMLAPARPQQSQGGHQQGHQQHQAGGRPRHPGYNNGGGGGGGGGGGRGPEGGGKRKRRGRNRPPGRDTQHHQRRDRDRGPRLPGFYNPGGD